MLKEKKLDDQNFEQILETAVNRLPALCPEWTDYNLHDPGITLIELFSWYEEQQRFHLDQITEEGREQLLLLLGVKPEKGTPARVLVDMTGAGGVWPEGARLHTDENICFELEDRILITGMKLNRVLLKGKSRTSDITALLKREDSLFRPFRHAKEETDLLLEFEHVESGELKLWFEVNPEDTCPRNPFDTESILPRGIRWFWNEKEVLPRQDETHALSMSGFVVLDVTPGERGELRLELADPGCEETVWLRGISCHCCRAAQTETWCRMFRRTVDAGPAERIDIEYGPAADSTMTVFLRTKKGWEQTRNGLEEYNPHGKSLTLDTRSAAQDGRENLIAVCTSDGCLDRVLFSSNGLPNQEFSMTMDRRKPVGEFWLICDTRKENGEIGPVLWRETADLSVCGPKDHVFHYDAERECLQFGDGLHGAVVPAGENSILVAELKVSCCSAGNISGKSRLRFSGEQQTFTCTSGCGGMEPETAEEACVRFLRKFSETRKCATASDYERIALRTPGLQVAMAKALPGFDPKNPFGNRDLPIVSVVVVPYSRRRRPMPDARFLKAVDRQLQKYRPVCTRVNVLAPKYIEMRVDLKLSCEKKVTEEILKEEMTAWFRERQIGSPIVKNDLTVRLQKIPGVWKLEYLSIEASGSGCRKNSMGDVLLPPDGIAHLENVRIRTV